MSGGIRRRLSFLVCPGARADPMNRLFDALRPVIAALSRRPLLVLLVALALAGVGAERARFLTIDSDFANLVPPDYPSVRALTRLRETVGGEADVAVAIESPSFEANRRFADSLVARAMRLESAPGSPYFTRVVYRRDVDFLKRNALFLASDAELGDLQRYLRGQIEVARLEANPFYFELGDLDADNPDASGDPSARLDSAAGAMQRAYGDLIGTEYPVSSDSTTLVLRFYPGDTQTNLAFVRAVYRDLEAEITEMQPAGYHPRLQTTLGGRLLRQQIEVDAITADVGQSFGGGVAAMLVLVVGFFVYKSAKAKGGGRLRGRIVARELLRAPALTLVIAVPMAVALAWTFGTAFLMYGKLNLFTSTLALVLFGMGIDYGIHYYGRYAEERGGGRGPVEAATETFATTGEAIVTTGLTTAAAFFLFMLADFRGFSEFGFIAGTGILFSIVAMTLVLPAVLVLFERIGFLRIEPRAGDEGGVRMTAQKRFPGARWVVRGGLVVLVASIALLPKLAFEYDFGKLDPTFTEYLRIQDVMRRVYSDRNRRNPAYIIADRAEDVPALEDTLRQIARRDTIIGAVETLQSRYPLTAAGKAQRLARIDTIRTLLSDAAFQSEAARGDSTLTLLRRAAETRQAPALAELPQELKQAFIAKDGSIGRLVVIYPRGFLSDGRKSMHFADVVGTVEAGGTTYHAGSTSIVAADMLRLMEEETPILIALTLLLIIALKVTVLRSFKWAFIALAPLLMGFIGTFGVMVLLGWKLNIYNMIVLPAILGIGDDAGIHITHRYKEEGPGSLRHVLSTVGEGVTMSAVTTMIGFGGQLTSSYPGLRSLGETAVLGIGMTLMTAMVFLPALIQWIEDREAAKASASA